MVFTILNLLTCFSEKYSKLDNKRYRKETAMDGIKNQDCLLKESEQFLTEEEILEIDGKLIKIDEVIMKKIGEIFELLGNNRNINSRLREAYHLAVTKLTEKEKDLKDKINILKKEEEEKKILIDKCNSLQQKYADLEKKNKELIAELDGVKKEKDEKERKLSEEKENSKWYIQHYTDARKDKEKAESDLKQLRELQNNLNRELSEKEEKVKELENLKEQLSEKTEKVHTLSEENQQYILQQQKMPALIRLYNAYNSVMEKRNELPQEFFERLQSVVPLDNFDSFLSKALRRSFPVCYYASIQSFIVMCSHHEEVSGEAMKKAILVSDDLLSVIFDFESDYFKEEKIFRINKKEGDSFDSDLCKYIDENGGQYGNIVKVWLHGFRDEKNKKIYCSYVEGE